MESTGTPLTCTFIGDCLHGTCTVRVILQRPHVLFRCVDGVS